MELRRVVEVVAVSVLVVLHLVGGGESSGVVLERHDLSGLGLLLPRAALPHGFLRVIGGPGAEIIVVGSILVGGGLLKKVDERDAIGILAGRSLVDGVKMTLPLLGIESLKGLREPALIISSLLGDRGVVVEVLGLSLGVNKYSVVNGSM